MKRIIQAVALCGALALAFALPSAQADPPVVSTAPATNVTQTSATLNGSLDPPQPFAAYAFEYGTTSNYGQQTPPQQAPRGSSLTPVQANITGLTPGTTYHFQLVAVITSAGSPAFVYGGDKTFTTISSGGPGPGGPGSANGSLRLVGKTLTVKTGKVSVSLWCLGPRACRGVLSISASHKTCVSSKAFSLGPGGAKTISPKVRGACRTLLRKAAKHRHRAQLTATLSTGQPNVSSKVTLVRHS